jgi:lysozyme
MNSFILHNGHSGQEIARLQTSLGGLTVDGEFGAKTEAAVRAYQKAHNLPVDGEAGYSTLAHLGIPVYAGVDVYNGSGDIDWKAVAGDNVKFAWVKCSEGTTFKDKSCQKNISGARKAGLIVGGYHFGRPDNGPKQGMQDAADEASNFLMASKGIQCGDLRPVLDLEAGIKSDDSYNAEWALKWLQVVEGEIGVKPVVYCAKWATDLFLRDARVELRAALATYPCWWASYNTGVNPKRGVAIWAEWDVWQWTGSGKTAGIKGKSDKNWMSGGNLENLRITDILVEKE